MIEDALSENRRLVALLEGLQALARGEATPPLLDDVELADLVAVALAAAEARYPGVQWTCELPEEPVVVRGWEPGLRMLVDNLVVNAARHGGGAVAVTLTAVSPGAELVVDDDGPGVAEDERERIFEPFVRADGVDSAGLGTGARARQPAGARAWRDGRGRRVAAGWRAVQRPLRACVRRVSLSRVPRPALLLSAFVACVAGAVAFAGCGGDAPPKQPTEHVRLEISGPADGSTLRRGTAEVRGSVSPRASAVTVLGRPALVSDGRFEIVVPLEPGVNVIDVMATAPRRLRDDDGAAGHARRPRDGAGAGGSAGG